MFQFNGFLKCCPIKFVALLARTLSIRNTLEKIFFFRVFISQSDHFTKRRTRNGCWNERKQGVRIPFKVISQKQNKANIFSCAYHWVIHFEYNLFTDISWNENLINARASTIMVGIDHQFWCGNQLPTISQKSEQSNRTKHKFSWKMCCQIYFGSKF